MAKKKKEKPEVEVEVGVLDVDTSAPEEAFVYMDIVNVANLTQRFSAQLNDDTAIYNMTTGIFYIAEKAGLDFPINGTITDLLSNSIIKLR